MSQQQLQTFDKRTRPKPYDATERCPDCDHFYEQTNFSDDFYPQWKDICNEQDGGGNSHCHCKHQFHKKRETQSAMSQPTPEAEVSPAIEEAIARPPFRIQGRTRSTTLENIPVIARDGEAPEAYAPGDADFVLNAMNAFDSHKAEIERLNSLHDTLCSVLCRETETQTPIAAITAIRAHKAKVERLEAALRQIASQKLRAEIEPDEDGEITGDFEYAYDMMIEVARAALIEPPEKENGTV